MLRRAATVVLLAILGAFTAFEAYVYTHREDAPPFEDSDLASRWRPIPDERNARFRLLVAAQELVWSEQTARRLRELRAEDAWDSALARELLAPNAAVLGAFDAALDGAFYQPTSLESARPSESEIRKDTDDAIRVIELTDLCISRSIQSAHVGKGERAIDDAFRCFRFGQRQASMPGARITDVMEGAAAQGRALTALRISLPHLRVGAADSRRRETELDEIRIASDAWRSAWAEEYQQTRGHIALAARAETDGRPIRWVVPAEYTLQPNRSLGLLADAVRNLRASADRPCTQRDLGPEPTPFIGWHLIPENETLAVALIGPMLALESLTPNGMGDFFVGVSIPTWRKADLLRCHASTLPGVAQALIGLRAYQLEHAELPPSLDSLVPAYLSRTPADRFDGAPLRYSRERKLIWSVGTDLRDDGGEAPKDAKDPRADPSWRILF